MGANELFESAAVWDQELQAGQRNLIQAITDHWPAETASVLDVGCGDGKITRALSERTGAVFHGLDASHEALARIKHLRTTVGSAADLPFSDGAFDAALSTDVFEHLPDDVEKAAWREIFRVARSWVFVAVPFREELLDATTRCPTCGAQYHVNWHLRTYDFKDLETRAPAGWHLSGLILSGEAWSPMLPPETAWRRQVLDEWSGWTEALCPQCGSHGVHAPRPGALHPEAAIELGQKIYARARRQHFLRSHSEILAIYNRTGAPPAQAGNLPVRSALRPAASWNATQVLSPNLDPYPQHGKMVAAVEGGFIVQLPVYPDAPHRIQFTLKENVGSVPIIIEDGRGLLLRTVIDGGSRSTFDVDLPRDPVPGYHGLIIRISGAQQPLQSVLFGRAPEVSWLSPAGENTGYFRVPGSKLSIQVNEPLSFDQRAIESVRSSRDGDVGSGSSSKTVLMLCHDQHLDRRVIAQARSLISRGVNVTLLALAFDAEGSEEVTPEGVRVVRIGLSEIVPENRIYNTYKRLQRGLN
ncbi:MAG TPA: class I SAM-dependent methyltransferase, partial [Hyphomicrobium sp.]|nr:class I SAM-dependent methyltransferase [Hyphomicrobium sp.]